MAAPIGIVWDEQPLGLVSDASVALALGCSVGAVAQARERRGIRAVRRVRSGRRKIQTRRSINMRATTYALIEAHAARLNMPMSALVEFVVNEALDRTGAPIPERVDKVTPRHQPAPHASIMLL